MAANYDRAFTHKTEQLAGGSRLVPVYEVGFYTLPSNIYAVWRFNMSVLDTTQIDPILAITARDIELLATDARVAGLAYIQDVTAAGQLVDRMQIVVQSTSGNSTDTFDQDLNNLDGFVVGPIIQRHVDALNAVEAL